MRDKEWFEKRIGKTVYRSNVTCKCSVCWEIRANGTFIRDQNHAEYLFMIESYYIGDPKEVEYFDIMDEVLEYESDLSTSNASKNEVQVVVENKRL